jgi:hypothetical protein
MSQCSNLRVAGPGIGADPAGRPLYDVHTWWLGKCQAGSVAIANPKVAILVTAKMP